VSLSQLFGVEFSPLFGVLEGKAAAHSRHKPRHRGGVNLEQAGRVGGGLITLGDHLVHFGLLLSGEFWPASANSLSMARSNSPEGAAHLHHHASGWRGREQRIIC
jgi:hypothetical protein